MNPQTDIFAHKDSGPKLLVQAFEARCQIHRVAKGRVVHALNRPKVTDHGLPDMNAKSREEWLQTLSLKLGVELFARQSAHKSCPASSLDMVRLWIGCVPEDHHSVADELVDCSAFGEESLRQHGEIARRLVHESVGVGGLGDRRKIPDVGEKDGNLFSDSASSVEMELSMTRRTSSLGTKWANDHMARCDIFIALPSS